MSDGDLTVPPQNPNPEPATPPAPTPPADVEFDGEFDEARAKALIANLRAEKAEKAQRLAAIQAERDELAQKWQAHENEQMTEAQRRDAELAATKAELVATRRAQALASHGLDASALIFLTAESAEDIEAQASALAALRGPVTEPPATPDLHSTPSPDLPPSAGPAIPPVDPPFDPRAIALSARRGGRR